MRFAKQLHINTSRMLNIYQIYGKKKRFYFSF